MPKLSLDPLDGSAGGTDVSLSGTSGSDGAGAGAAALADTGGDAASAQGGTSATASLAGAGGISADAGASTAGASDGTSSGGAGGGTSSGGAGGRTCAAPSGGTGWFFATDAEGFAADAQGINASLAWVDQGCPDSGAIALSIDFTGPDQAASASIRFAALDISTGAGPTAWVKLPSAAGERVAAIFMKDDHDRYASGPTASLFASTDWVERSGDLRASAAYTSPGFDPTRAMELGVQLNTPPNTPLQALPTVLLIDSVTR